MTVSGVEAAVKDLLDREYDNTLLAGLALAETVTVARTPEVSATAVVASYTPAEIAATRDAEIKISAKDLKVRVRASAELGSMTTADVIRRDGKLFRVLSVEEKRVGGEVYEWICQARK